MAYGVSVVGQSRGMLDRRTGSGSGSASGNLSQPIYDHPIATSDALTHDAYQRQVSAHGSHASRRTSHTLSNTSSVSSTETVDGATVPSGSSLTTHTHANAHAYHAYRPPDVRVPVPPLMAMHMHMPMDAIGSRDRSGEQVRSAGAETVPLRPNHSSPNLYQIANGNGTEEYDEIEAQYLEPDDVSVPVQSQATNAALNKMQQTQYVQFPSQPAHGYSSHAYASSSRVPFTPPYVGVTASSPPRDKAHSASLPTTPSRARRI